MKYTYKDNETIYNEAYELLESGFSIKEVKSEIYSKPFNQSWFNINEVIEKASSDYIVKLIQQDSKRNFEE